MPLFDLKKGIEARYRTGATPAFAYEAMKKIVVTFAQRGYRVRWIEERPPHAAVAQLTDKDGTDLRADAKVVDEGTVTRCDIRIDGAVFLGGLLGRLVSASTIESKAQGKIKEMLDEAFAGQPAKRAVTTSPPPSAPSATPAAVPVPVPVAAVARPTPAETWSAVCARALAGDVVSEATLRTRAAAAAGALGDPGLVQFVHIALAQCLAKARGKKLDSAGAAQLLARIGAAPAAQHALAKSAQGVDGVLAAYALTAAVGEVAARALDADAPADAALEDLFGAAFERVAGEKRAPLKKGTAAGDKLAQLKEAYDDDLVTEAELWALRERVLAGI